MWSTSAPDAQRYGDWPTVTVAHFLPMTSLMRENNRAKPVVNQLLGLIQSRPQKHIVPRYVSKYARTTHCNCTKLLKSRPIVTNAVATMEESIPPKKRPNERLPGMAVRKHCKATTHDGNIPYLNSIHSPSSQDRTDTDCLLVAIVRDRVGFSSFFRFFRNACVQCTDMFLSRP